jgi:hypothetical protein
MVNELEVVVWAIYLDRLGWFSPFVHPVQSLSMTCFAVKMYLTAEAQTFLPYLNGQWNGFALRFNGWLQQRQVQQLKIPPVLLNNKFRQLGRTFLWSQTKASSSAGAGAKSATVTDGAKGSPTTTPATPSKSEGGGSATAAGKKSD